MIRRPPRSTQSRSSAASDVYKRQSYDPVRDEVIGLDHGTKGLSYSINYQARYLTADALRKAQGPGPANEATYLQMPVTTNQGKIVDLARQLAAGAATRYDAAMALQTYLRNTNMFTYDTQVPPSTSDDAVWDFLQSRRGYCVQFSTAMVMMARALFIPARLGVGFLEGAPGRDLDTFVITGRQALSLIHISEPTRLGMISYAVF